MEVHQNHNVGQQTKNTTKANVSSIYRESQKDSTSLKTSNEQEMQ